VNINPVTPGGSPCIDRGRAPDAAAPVSHTQHAYEAAKGSDAAASATPPRSQLDPEPSAATRTIFGDATALQAWVDERLKHEFGAALPAHIVHAVSTRIQGEPMFASRVAKPGAPVNTERKDVGTERVPQQ